MTMAALSGSRYIEYLLRPMRDSIDVTQSDLGTEEDLEMLLNTFSGYDMEIADLSQLGANAERARTTSCLTSRSPGPAKPKDARCQESRMLGRFEAAVRGGADNFTTSETSENVTKVIAVQAKGMLWEGCWVPWKTLGRQQQYRDRLQSTTFQSTSAPGAREDG